MAEATPLALASLSLTHVHYDPNDPISFICAWLALVPQALCIVYATLIWSTREIEILMMFGGQLACEAFNFALKRTLKQDRPKVMHGKGYGMPSSHAQFVAFFSLSLMLFLLFRHKPKRPTDMYTPLSLGVRIILSGVVFVFAAAVAWSRIYLNYHTLKQVLVGYTAGTIFAIVWFVVTTIVRQSGLLAWILDLDITRLFRMRDLVVEEDMCQAGWEIWETQRRSKLAKRSNGNGKKRR